MESDAATAIARLEAELAAVRHDVEAIKRSMERLAVLGPGPTGEPEARTSHQDDPGRSVSEQPLAGGLYEQITPAANAARNVPPPPSASSRVTSRPQTQPKPRWSVSDLTMVGSETWLRWIGALLVFLALVFAASTVIQRGWIGPRLQLVLAVAAALALAAVGVRLHKTSRVWGVALGCAGSCSLLAVWGLPLAIRVVGAGPATAALLVCFCAVLALAHWLDGQLILFLGATVLTVSLSHLSEVRSSSFFLITAVIIVWIAVAISADQRDWAASRALALIAVLFWLSVVAFEVERDPSDANKINFGLSALLLIAASHILPSRLKPRESANPTVKDGTGPHPVSGWQQLEMRTAMVIVPWLGTVGMHTLLGETSWLSTLAVVAGSAAYTLVARGFLRDLHLASLLFGCSVGLTIACGQALEANVLALVLLMQAVALIWLANRRVDSTMFVVHAALLSGYSLLWAVDEIARGWERQLSPTQISVVAGIIAIATFGVALVEPEHLRKLLGAVVLALVFGWVGTLFVHVSQGQMIVTLIWGSISLGLVVAAAPFADLRLAQVGLGALVVTVAKLFLVDLVEVDRLWRALLFMCIGVAILRLGFVMPRMFPKSFERDLPPLPRS